LLVYLFICFLSNISRAHLAYVQIILK
jgi:hypothetical protein